MRRWLVAALVAAPLMGCDTPTDLPPRFDVADQWEGTFQTATSARLLTLDLTATTSAEIRGTASSLFGDYDVEGAYEPPTVWLKLVGETESLEFVGEMLAFNIINGSMVLASDDVSEAGRLTLLRR